MAHARFPNSGEHWRSGGRGGSGCTRRRRSRGGCLLVGVAGGLLSRARAPTIERGGDVVRVLMVPTYEVDGAAHLIVGIHEQGVRLLPLESHLRDLGGVLLTRA